MGYIDSELLLSVSQAVTALGDTPSTNAYDAGVVIAQGDTSRTGENVWFNVLVSTTATSGGSATIQAVLQDSADNSTFADVLSGPVVAVASATAGTTLLQIQPPVGIRRYHRIAYRIGTATLTAGKFDAWLSNTIQKKVQRPNGFSVS